MSKNKRLLSLILAMMNICGLKNSSATPGDTQVSSKVDFKIETNEMGISRRFKKVLLPHKGSILGTLSFVSLIILYNSRGRIKTKVKVSKELKLDNFNGKNTKLENIKPGNFEFEPKPKNNKDDLSIKQLPVEVIKSSPIEIIKLQSKRYDQEFTDFVLKLKEKLKSNNKNHKYDQLYIYNPNYDQEMSEHWAKFFGDKQGQTYEDYRNGLAGFCAANCHGIYSIFSTVYYREFNKIETGWKIHVSSDFFHCTDVLKIVEDLRERRNFNYKFVSSIYVYRDRFNVNEDQAGKFVTIYPKSDEEAKWIVEELNKRFVEKGFDESCFLKVKNDFKVYPGIYVRMSEYGGNFDDYSAREKLRIPPGVFEEHCKSVKSTVEDYQHPFEKLYANGVEMPKKVREINDRLNEKK